MIENIESSREFAAQMRREIDEGISIVPFVGSGLSATSGILMGQDFTDFLAFTVYHCISTRSDRKDLHKRFPEFRNNWKHENRWDIRLNGWPKYPNQSETLEAKQWISGEFREICKESGFKVEPEPAPEERFCRPVTDIVPLNSGTPKGAENLATSLNRPFAPRVIRAPEYGAPDLAVKELLRLLKAQHVIRDYIGSPENSPTSERHIVERGIRSLHEWRATLRFLSEIQLQAQPECDGRLILGKPDSTIVDSFNIHITSGKKCNLGHKMLAHLARPLRSRFILTTNFDDLIEEAFTQILTNLEVFELTTNGTLPPPETVRAQNCLIKLHGGKLDTRADFSLDDPPADIDKENFAQYLLGCRHPSDHAPGHNPSHLLVVGYSGRDIRCIQLIKYVLDLSPEFRIYWICYNMQDQANVKRIFGGEGYDEQVVTITTDRPDLLLYEAYQKLTLSLPGGGFAYQFVNKVPPERPGQSDEQSNLAMDRSLELVELIEAQSHPDELSAMAENYSDELITYRCIVPEIETRSSHLDNSGRIILVDAQSGLGKQMTSVVHSLSDSSYQSIWLELQDYSNTRTLHQEVFKVISLRLGYFQLEHFVFSTTSDQSGADGDDWVSKLPGHIRLLNDHIGVQPGRWVLYFYGRGCPGGCSGWQNQPWDEEDYRVLKRYIEALAKIGFVVVYMPYSESRHRRLVKRTAKIRRIVKRWPVRPPNDQNQRFHEAFRGIDHPGNGSDPRDPLKLGTTDTNWKLKRLHAESGLTDYTKVIDFVQTKYIQPFFVSKHSKPKKLVARNLRRLQFLYALTLFRQSRHFSAFLCEGVYRSPERYGLFGYDNDENRAEEVTKWIKELEDAQVLYHKPGGYSWKYRDVRLGIQYLIESLARPDDGMPENNALPYDFVGQVRARTHFWIGEWYQKAFFATGHSLPLFESVYHRFQTIRYSPFAKPSRLSHEKAEDEIPIQKYRRHLFESSLLEMIKTLQMARPWLKFWLYNPSQTSVFGPLSSDDPIGTIESVAQLLDPRKSSSWWKRVEHYRIRLQSELNSLNSSLKAEADTYTGKEMEVTPLPRNFDSEYDALEKRIRGVKALTHNADVVAGEDWRKRFDRYLEKLNFKDWSNLLNPKSDTKCEMNSISELCGDSNQEFPVENKQLKRRITPIIDTLEWELTRLKSDSMYSAGGCRLPSGQPGLCQLISVLNEYAYVHIKRAKMESESIDLESSTGPRILWLKASIICRFTLDLCRTVDPCFLDFEIDQRIKAQTLFGLALGHLGRFFEAHRRLTEAFSLLSKRRPALIGPEHAIIKLRRAEIYLLEQRKILRQANTKEANGTVDLEGTDRLKSRAFLDDAWNCLESGKRSLSGQSHSSLWWGRLVALQLRAISQHHTVDGKVDKGTLAFRKRVHPEDEILRLFNRGFLISPSGAFRQLRCIRLFLKAYRRTTGTNLSERELEELLDRVENMKDRMLPDLIENLRSDVHSKIMVLLPAKTKARRRRAATKKKPKSADGLQSSKMHGTKGLSLSEEEVVELIHIEMKALLSDSSAKAEPREVILEKLLERLPGRLGGKTTKEFSEILENEPKLSETFSEFQISVSRTSSRKKGSSRRRQRSRKSGK